MKTITKIALLSLLMGYHLLGLAEEKENDKNPIGCQNIGYKFDLKTLQLTPRTTGAVQSLYVLFNTSNQPVNLYQMRSGESSYSMYLNHAIGPKEWAVLSTNELHVNYLCATPDKSSAYGTIIDCADSLRVCEYTKVKFGLNNQGNYWLINSSSKNEAIRGIVRYGIIPFYNKKKIEVGLTN